MSDDKPRRLFGAFDQLTPQQHDFVSLNANAMQITQSFSHLCSQFCSLSEQILRDTPDMRSPLKQLADYFCSWVVSEEAETTPEVPLLIDMPVAGMNVLLDDEGTKNLREQAFKPCWLPSR